MKNLRVYIRTISKLGHLSRPPSRLYWHHLNRGLSGRRHCITTTSLHARHLSINANNGWDGSESSPLFLSISPCLPNGVVVLRTFHSSRILASMSGPERPTTENSTPPDGSVPPPPIPLATPPLPPPVKLPTDKQLSVGNDNGTALMKPAPKDISKVSDAPTVKAEEKKTLVQRFVAELKHYYHGFKLLLFEIKISLKLSFRLFKGKTLTRRERKQLVRTVADIVRMLPFVAFLIIPFMEFLLPFYLKFFPFMLPSTFKEEAKEQLKIRQLLKGKLEMAKFLQETLAESTGVKRKVLKDTPTVSEFQSFLIKTRESGLMAETKDILRYSRLFEDEVTLDSLTHLQLRGLCRLLELTAFGPDQLLRFQIRMRVRNLHVDDKMILNEGVDKLPIWELQALCRERGMRSLGLSEERLRSQLSQWLDLHLKQNVPISLLLFSRTMYLPEAFSKTEQIQKAIGQLPNLVSKEATLKAAESSEARIDHQTKFEVLREEEKMLERERVEQKRAKKAAAEAAVKDKESDAAALEEKATVDTAPVLEDTAPVVASKSSEELEKPPVKEVPEMPPVGATDPNLDLEVLSLGSPTPELPAEITASDLAQIESAIGSLKETAMDEEELDDLKEDFAEVTELQRAAELVTSDSSGGKSKAAVSLGSRVNRMIGEMDGLIDDLHKQKSQLLEDIEVKEVRVKHQEEPEKKTELLDMINTKKERLVSINELMLSLRRIQKVPDDTRWQRILDVLDEDHDGKIELQHVLEVIELLGAENVKLTSEEMKSVIDVLEKEHKAAHLAKEQKNINNDLPVDLPNSDSPGDNSGADLPKK